jgi:hypothetical protein
MNQRLHSILSVKKQNGGFVANQRVSISQTMLEINADS